MSSAYSGRYQSRFFNFLSQKTRQLADQWDRTLRHVRYTGLIVTQTALYPVYLFLQAARVLRQQLRPGHSSTSHFDVSVKAETPTLSQPAPPPNLHPLDNATEVCIPALQPTLEQPTPWRQLWQLMAWVQHSSLALTANIFGEANLPQPTKPLEPTPPRPASPPPAFLSFLDRTLADLEAQPLPHVTKNPSSLTLNSSGRVQNAQPQSAALTLLYKYRITTVVADTFDRYIQQLLALIWAIVEYLLGNRESASEKAAAEQIYNRFHSQSRPPLPEEPDTWLTWNDLYGDALPAPPPQPQPPEPILPLLTETSTDIWETQAVSVEYVKHPLEQLLEWLDHAMLWLEEFGLQLWQQLSPYLSKRRHRKN